MKSCIFLILYFAAFYRLLLHSPWKYALCWVYLGKSQFLSFLTHAMAVTIFIYVFHGVMSMELDESGIICLGQIFQEKQGFQHQL